MQQNKARTIITSKSNSELLTEYGIEALKIIDILRAKLPEILEDSENELSF